MDLVNELIKQPLVQGLVLKQLMDMVKVWLKKVDDEGLAKQHAGWLQPSLIVLTLLTSAISLALQGQLGSLDLSQLQVYLLAVIQTYVGAKAAGTVTGQKLANKVSPK